MISRRLLNARVFSNSIAFKRVVRPLLVMGCFRPSRHLTRGAQPTEEEVRQEAAEHNAEDAELLQLYVLNVVSCE